MRRIAALALLLVSVACGGSGASKSKIVDTVPKGPPAPPPKAVSCTPAQVTSAAGAEPFGTKPSVAIPDAPPPQTMLAEDLIAGAGAVVTPSSPITVQYVGVSWSTKAEFDTSWGKSGGFPLTIAEGRVIKGWLEGIPGMKIGGRRRLTIPPSCGYGAQGSPPVIKPSETLVFIVDVVSSP